MTFEALRERLLSIGGMTVKPAPGGVDNAIDALLSDGREVKLRIRDELMDPGFCNRNVAQLWQDRKVEAMCTGYALDPAGDVWRQHWWGISEGHIVETTARRSRYFGICRIGEDADRWSAEVLRKLRDVGSDES
jgi:hypothetical protein